MVETTVPKSMRLNEAYKELMMLVKGAAGEQLRAHVFTILAEIEYISPKNYNGVQYVQAHGGQGNPIQLIVPAALAGTLQRKHVYAVTGCFEVCGNPEFGLFRFRVAEAQLVGQALSLEAKKQAASEIVEKGYLNKYKDDFSRFRGKASCKVALITSSQSQVIRDVLEVFKQRPGIRHELIPVKLSDAKVIAEGISYAAGGEYDVLLMVRGGGSEEQFAVFDDPLVVQAIHASAKPVIVGIGHTDNNTFADQVADRSETTPTKAARFLVDMLGERQLYEAAKPQKTYPQPYKGNWAGGERRFRQAQAGSAGAKFSLFFIGVAVGAGLLYWLAPVVWKSFLP